ncbi:MAG: sugar phosphate nucleotidyltransferase, partial [Crocinitomicaceae bacterium]
MENNNYGLIMAGGVGSRFWPMSTPQKPKQFLDVLGTGKSLLRLTFERLQKTVPSNQNYSRFYEVILK